MSKEINTENQNVNQNKGSNSGAITTTTKNGAASYASGASQKNIDLPIGKVPRSPRLNNLVVDLAQEEGLQNVLKYDKTKLYNDTRKRLPTIQDMILYSTRFVPERDDAISKVHEEGLPLSYVCESTNIKYNTLYGWTKSNKRKTKNARSQPNQASLVDKALEDEYRSYLKNYFKNESNFSNSQAIKVLSEKYPDFSMDSKMLHKTITSYSGFVVFETKTISSQDPNNEQANEIYYFNSNRYKNYVFVGEAKFYREANAINIPTGDVKKEKLRYHYMVAISSKGIVALDRVHLVETRGRQKPLNPNYYLDFVKRVLNILPKLEMVQQVHMVISKSATRTEEIKALITRKSYQSSTAKAESKEPIGFFWEIIRRKLYSTPVKSTGWGIEKMIEECVRVFASPVCFENVIKKAMEENPEESKTPQ